MKMQKFEKEYVQRTKIIIEKMPQDFKYEVTLLLNCLNGLISLPTERTPNGDSFSQNCIDKLKEMHVIIKETSEEQTFRTIRNAIAHANIEPENQDAVIHSVILRDKKPKSSQYHTKLRFTVEQLKEYALFVADQHLQRYKD